MNFNLITYFNQAYDIQAPEIRKISRMCLFKIQSNGDETVQKQLSQLGYLISLTSVIYAAGGSGKVDNDQEINLIIINIFEFFKQLYFGTNNGDTQFPPHPSLAKLSYEQLEEEGCLEEIEALIINKGVDNIKFCTNGAKQTISNIFVNKSNPSPY
ncbi:MAG: hypothetical protein EZS28_016905 [Streblomastix strix]|uniref:Uncharacterized protein n=1 Tax=Streblomastix strix TaxID=222440 RepID=A0A5J4VZ97_9EUKA|nr:MAG: hypothetical protein EZS28_016905 [Streblomastix strix]